MNSAFDSVLVEMQNVAQKQHWASIATLISTLQVQTAMKRLLLVAQDNVETAPLQRWLNELAQDMEIVTLSAQQLMQETALAIEASKVLIVCACGQLIGATTVEMVHSAIFVRPQGTYAIVLSQAEQIQTEQDLDLVERGIRRLFLANRALTEDTKDLCENGIFLWSTVPAQDHWLQARFQHDSSMFAQWIQTPLKEAALATELQRYQVLAVLQRAENEVQSALQTAQATQDTAQHLWRIHQARERITELKGRLLNRMFMNIDGVERTMLTSLRTLQADLHDELPGYLKSIPRVTSMDEQTFRGVIADFIATRASRWQKSTNDLLITNDADTANDIEDFLSDIDWRIINEVLKAYEQEGGYPTVLIEQLQGYKPGAAPHLALEQNVEGHLVNSSRSFVTLIPVLPLTAGAGIASSIAFLLRFGPIGIVATGVMGLVGAGLLVLKGRSDHSLEAYEQYGQEAILLVIRQVTQRLQEQIQDYKRAQQQQVEVELDKLTQWLDLALREHQQPANQQLSSTTLLDQLQAYKQFVMQAAL